MNRSSNRKYHVGDLLLILSAGLFLLLMGAFLLLPPQSAYSLTENRRLKTFPLPSVRAVADGSYFRDFSDFSADQLPLRSQWILGKASVERILGKGENNGILFGKDGFLIPRGEYASLSVAKTNLDAVRRFSENSSISVTTLILPRHIDLLPHHLPEGFSRLRASSLPALLDKEKEILFPVEEWEGHSEHLFRTDHHRTAEGAYASYALLGTHLGYTPKEENFFSRIKVSDSFLGTSHSKSGGMAESSDEVWLWRYEGDTDYEIRDLSTGESRSSFYDTSALSRKDHYEIFLGGNTAALTVSSPEHDRPRLLLIKDSFANALIPFLSLHFDLTVLDLRYGLPSSLNPSDFQKVLILQGADTLATDASLTRLSLVFS